MAVVVPTILATTPAEYDAMRERAESLSKRIHVDICDDRFVRSKTIGLAQVHASEGIEIDLHLMVQDPAVQLSTALSLKPHLIIFHAESEGNIEDMIVHTRELGIKAGVALLPETTIASVEALLAKADHALVFTGELGQNGGIFQMDELHKVTEIKTIKPTIEVSVDGGVNDENAALIRLQGVDVLYSGAFLQRAEDPQAAYDSITKQLAEAV